MSIDNLLSIGGFSLVSGLSVHALRHYDEIGLLRPAYVDPHNGYRRYRPEQVREALVISALRRVELPVGEVRRIIDDPAAVRRVLGEHRARLVERAAQVSAMVRTVEQYIENGVVVPDLKSPRIVQVTINVTDLDQSIAFYTAAFGAQYQPENSSFVFGTWPDDQFFMLTLAHPASDQPAPEHGERPGPAGVSRFGLLVADVDTAHQRALAAGGVQRYAPVDSDWKPRTSCVVDPSGNLIDLYQS